MKSYVDYETAKLLSQEKFPNKVTKTNYLRWTKESDFPRDRLPADPRYYYRSIWMGWPAFCGRQPQNKQKVDFAMAKKIVGTAFPLGCPRTAYREWTRRSDFPSDKLPYDPMKYYGRQGTWTNWPDFAGTIDRVSHATKKLLPYEIASQLVAENFPGGCTRKVYKSWINENKNLHKTLPLDPESYYGRRNEWQGWNAFCGKKTKDITGYLYVLENPVWKGYTKVGISQKDRLAKRLSEYNTCDPLKRFQYKFTASFRHNKVIERLVHHHFASHRVSGSEWLMIESDVIIGYILQLMEIVEHDAEVQDAISKATYTANTL